MHRLLRPTRVVCPRCAVAIVAFAAACSARAGLGVDPATLTPDARRAAEARGRAIVTRGCTALGGRERFDALGGLAVTLASRGAYYPAGSATYYVDVPSQRVFAVFPAGPPDPSAPRAWGAHAGRGAESRAGRCERDPARAREVARLASAEAYWLGLPCKLLDEGAHPLAAAPATLDGAPVDRVLVTFERGTGSTPDDWFLAYVDRASGWMPRVIYRSTAFAPTEIEVTLAGTIAAPGGARLVAHRAWRAAHWPYRTERPALEQRVTRVAAWRVPEVFPWPAGCAAP